MLGDAARSRSWLAASASMREKRQSEHAQQPPCTNYASARVLRERKAGCGRVCPCSGSECPFRYDVRATPLRPLPSPLAKRPCLACACDWGWPGTEWCCHWSLAWLAGQGSPSPLLPFQLSSTIHGLASSPFLAPRQASYNGYNAEKKTQTRGARRAMQSRPPVSCNVDVARAVTLQERQLGGG